MTDPGRNVLLAAALDYAQRGWPVVALHSPVNGRCSCGKADCGTPGKHPRWHEADLPNGVHSATTNEKIIRLWWKRWPPANIGIATGPVSGLLVPDVDPRNGGNESLKKLPGNMPYTPTTRTGGDGEHYLLKYPENGLQIRGDLGFAGYPGIDIKANGLIVAPPSLHASGKRYVWKITPDSTPLAPAPDWLLQLIRQETAKPGHKTPVGEVIPTGSRVNVLRSLAGTMRRRGLNEAAILAALEGINQYQCEEPLPDSKIRDIAKSYGRYEAGAINAQADKPKSITPAIRLVSGTELQRIEFQEPQWIIEAILPEGLCLLSARPKKGKTWMAMDIATAVATGGCAFGKGDLRVTKGGALFLCLEDRLRRFKKRLGQILQDIPFPSDLIIADTWPRLDKGGLEALQDFLKEHSDCKLVVVDSFSKIKPPRPKNTDPYEFEMMVGGALQSLAQERQICLLLIYHNRKSEGEDPLDDVIGSTGLTGAVDAILVLRRGRGKVDGTLFVTGRDVEEQELALKFHAQEGLWELLGDAAEYALSGQRQEILQALRENGPKTPKEIAEILGKKHNTIKGLLFKMVKSQDLKSLDGRYEIIEK